MTEPADFATRPATDKDWPFILQSWTRSYAREVDPGPLAPRAVADAVHASVTRLLEKPGVEVAVATNPHNAWFIFGYVVFERAADGPILHWVYVKDLYRGMRIGSDLVAYARGEQPGQLRVTFRTKAASRLVPEAKYAPKLAHPKGPRGNQPHQRQA
jgi:hypothetical protein